MKSLLARVRVVALAPVGVLWVLACLDSPSFAVGHAPRPHVVTVSLSLSLSSQGMTISGKAVAHRLPRKSRIIFEGNTLDLPVDVDTSVDLPPAPDGYVLVGGMLVPTGASDKGTPSPEEKGKGRIVFEGNTVDVPLTPEEPTPPPSVPGS